MATGLAAMTAAFTWSQNQWRRWRAERAARAYRNWHGFITTAGVDSWYVRLAEDPDSPTARVVLEVVDRGGEPDAPRAYSMRQRAATDGMLARVPTPDEYDFLDFLHRERGYGKGTPVR
jgi:hypothetical protein